MFYIETAKDFSFSAPLSRFFEHCHSIEHMPELVQSLTARLRRRTTNTAQSKSKETKSMALDTSNPNHTKLIIAQVRTSELLWSDTHPIGFLHLAVMLHILHLREKPHSAC